MNGIHPLLLSAYTPETAADRLLSQTKRGSFAVTLNVELLARAATSPDFAAILRTADAMVCDGIGGRLLLSVGHPRAAIPRIPGIDLGYAVLARATGEGRSVFLLGGKEGIAEKAALCLKEKLPALQIAGTYHGYFGKSDLPALRGLIIASGAEIVIVCLGSPRQEEWIAQNRRYLPNVCLYLPLGGSLDVWAGEILRAPLPLRKAGLEWAWRVARQPRRLIRLGRAAWALWGMDPQKWDFHFLKSTILFPIQ